VSDSAALAEPLLPTIPAVLVAALLVGAIGAVWIGDREPSGPASCGGLEHAFGATASPVRHLFVIIKENHALENYFATYPGVIGNPPTGVFPTTFGGNQTIAPFPLPGTSTPDLPHDRASELVDLDHGSNDLFVAQADRNGAVAPNDAVGYYTQSQLEPYFALAHNYTLDDMFFSGVLGPTLPNRLFDLAATSGGWTSDAIPPPANMTFPTILGQLSASGIPWQYDYSGSEENLTPLVIPSIASSTCAMAQIQPVSDLAAQLNGSTPPAVTFVDPSHDPLYSEHPPQNVSLGADWTLSVLQTIFSSAIGPSSAAVVLWDEAGGFWDPVTPPAEGALGDGIRIPFLVVSPWTPANVIDHAVLDPASVLAFIDQNWQLSPLNPRVAAAPSLSQFFDFARPPRPFEAPRSAIALGSDGSTPVNGPDARPDRTAPAGGPGGWVPPAAARASWEPSESICGARRLARAWPRSGSPSTTRSRCCSNRRERSSPSR